MTEDKPTVFIVDDDHGMRASLAWLMQSVNLASKVFASAQEFLGSYDRVQPGCVLLDIRMPGMSGLQLLEELRSRGIALPTIVMTAYGEVTAAVRAMRIGAFDFLEKPFSDQSLLERVGEALESDLRRRKAQEWLAKSVVRQDSLTARQREIMDLMVSGTGNKAIARAFGISVKTVEAHRAVVMRKMQAANIAQLVRMATLCKVIRVNPNVVWESYELPLS